MFSSFLHYHVLTRNQGHHTYCRYIWCVATKNIRTSVSFLLSLSGEPRSLGSFFILSHRAAALCPAATWLFNLSLFQRRRHFFCGHMCWSNLTTLGGNPLCPEPIENCPPQGHSRRQHVVPWRTSLSVFFRPSTPAIFTLLFFFIFGAFLLFYSSLAAFS